MKIEKQKDGSNKVVYEDGQCYFIQKDRDPIDGLIDIGLMQKKTAEYIEHQPILFEDYLMPETFFYALSREYQCMARSFLKHMDWFISAINEFNVEIGKQQRLREGKNVVSNVAAEDNYKEAVDGKYEICLRDVLPELIWKRDMLEQDEDPDLTHQYIIAFTLLRFIYCGIDIRKIEARISELKGYCAFLEKTTPDEFKAYCVIMERIGIESELDIDMYYEIWNSIEERV